MSKELMALKRIRYIHDTECGKDESINKDFETVEKALIDKEETDNILNTGGGIWAENGIVGKKLKALEIIKEKNVDVALFVKSKSAVDYNGLRMIMFRKQAERDYSGVLLKYGLIQEEYDLLKGVLL